MLSPPDNPAVSAAAVSKSWLTGDQGQPRTPDAKVSYVVRRQETNLGNLIADSLLWMARVGGGWLEQACGKQGHVMGSRAS